ncbi:MAG: methyltransferase [Candidatus Binataceae bacterium]
MDFAELAGLAGAHAEARAIQVALKLGVFRALANDAADAQSLARAIHCDQRATALLANALVALGLLAKNGELLSLGAAARRYLLDESTEYMGGMILFDESIFALWANLENSIRSGRPARTPDMFQNKAEETENFIGAMDSLVRARGDAVWLAEHLDLAGVATIADVGGGPGTYLVELLRMWPQLRGSIYDLGATLKVARRLLEQRDAWALARLELREVDYLRDELPGPCDALLLSNIIHSEDEAANAELARKCFRALSSGGRVIIKDHVMNRDLTEPRAGAVFSLYLLLTTRGRDYSCDEVAGWLASAGFVDIGVQPLPSPPFTSSLVVAKKP